MRYLSVCSGIEAASVAFGPHGWEPVAFSEIDRAASAVLAHHYPGVPNWGDMSKFKDWPDVPNLDVLCGGTPCQSFSVAGLRKGLADPRGNLMLTFGAIAGRYRPKWLVWENVPGVLSSNGGRDFGTFLGMLGELGYGFAYRVLDAQHVRTRRFPRAVPQRRRRVFVVGYLGDWRRAAAVLFDRESLSGNPPPRREAGKGTAAAAAQGVAIRGREGGGTAELTGPIATALRAAQGGGDKPHVICANSGEIGYCLTASAQQSLDAETETETLIAEPVAFAHQAGGKQTTLGATNDGTCQTLGACQTPAIALHQPLYQSLINGVKQLTEWENEHADAAQARPGEALRALRCAYGAKTFREWSSGIASAFWSQEVLRSNVHGESVRRQAIKDEGLVDDAPPRPQGSSGRELSKVWSGGCDGCSPHRPRSHKQRSSKPDADMPKLPH